MHIFRVSQTHTKPVKIDPTDRLLVFTNGSLVSEIPTILNYNLVQKGDFLKQSIFKQNATLPQYKKIKLVSRTAGNPTIYVVSSTR
jgi:hypothetical protein